MTVNAHPVPDERPEVWLLGSSDSPARGQSAARLGAHFCLSLLHAATPPSPIAIASYRAEERRLERPAGHAAIAITVACIQSARERRRHQTPFPAIPGKAIVETAAICRERIEELCHAYGVREIAILECSDGLARRRESLQRLAEVFKPRAKTGARGGPTSGPRR